MQCAILPNPSLPAALILRDEIAARLDQIGAEHTDTLTRQTDIVITVGGDGTVLRAQGCGKPILGVHAGTVGFLTEIDRTELDLLSRLPSGDYRIQERMRLCAELSGAMSGAAGTCLNEIALTAPPESRHRRCVKITAFADGKPFAEYTGDGIVFATPTGSTGYSLSAGGAVLDPSFAAILLTPLYSHTLDAKPLVFSPESELSVVSRETLAVTADGGKPMTLPPGETLTIRRSPEPARFILLKETPFAARLQRLRF
ncbi:MAG: NAD(+)/NADH kinase [Oscillospiraceae bacterium]|jgi:NAD+ kinase|nr:NAD(+)/NADH kinase [Oscillospiraceae bacterium]